MQYPRLSTVKLLTPLMEKSGSGNPEGEGVWKATFDKHNPAGRELRKLYLDLSLLVPSVSCQGLPLAKPNKKLSTGSPFVKSIQAIL